MPTLVKFVIVLAVLAGLVGAGMFYLANFVGPNTREMTVRVPADKLDPVPVVKPPAVPAVMPPAETPADAAAPAAQ